MMRGRVAPESLMPVLPLPVELIPEPNTKAMFGWRSGKVEGWKIVGGWKSGRIEKI